MNTVKSDIRLADQVVKAYAEGYVEPHGLKLTEEECKKLGLNSDDALSLMLALVDGEITREELNLLRTRAQRNEAEHVKGGIDQAFVDSFQGALGSRAATARIKWLGENINVSMLWFSFPDDQRRNMIAELSEFGANAQIVKSELVKALDDTNPVVRKQAALTLSQIDPTGGLTVSLLIPTLEDKDSDVRACVARILGNYTTRAKEAAIPSLIAHLTDTSELVQNAASMSLLNIGGPAFAAIIKLFKNNDPILRQLATDLFKRPSTHIGEAIAPLTIAINDSSNMLLRLGATKAFGYISSSARIKETSPRLLEAIRHQALPRLAYALNDKEESVREAATEAISKFGANAYDALPELVNALDDACKKVREYAAVAIGNIGPSAEIAIPKLINMVGPSEDIHVAIAAATALGKMGVVAKAAIYNLRVAANRADYKNPSDDDIELARVAVSSVGEMGVTADVENCMINALANDNSGIRVAAARAISRHHIASKAVLTSLISAITNHSDLYTIFYSALAIGNMGKDGKDGVGVLVGLLNSQNSIIQTAAVMALGLMGAVAKDAVPALKRANIHVRVDTTDFKVDTENIVDTICPAANNISILLSLSGLAITYPTNKLIRTTMDKFRNGGCLPLEDTAPAFVSALGVDNNEDIKDAEKALLKLGYRAILSLIAGEKDKNSKIRVASAHLKKQIEGQGLEKIGDGDK